MCHYYITCLKTLIISVAYHLDPFVCRSGLGQWFYNNGILFGILNAFTIKKGYVWINTPSIFKYIPISCKTIHFCVVSPIEISPLSTISLILYFNPSIHLMISCEITSESIKNITCTVAYTGTEILPKVRKIRKGSSSSLARCGIPPRCRRPAIKRMGHQFPTDCSDIVATIC